MSENIVCFSEPSETWAPSFITKECVEEIILRIVKKMSKHRLMVKRSFSGRKVLLLCRSFDLMHALLTFWAHSVRARTFIKTHMCIAIQFQEIFNRANTTCSFRKKIKKREKFHQTLTFESRFAYRHSATIHK